MFVTLDHVHAGGSCGHMACMCCCLCLISGWEQRKSCLPRQTGQTLERTCQQPGASPKDCLGQVLQGFLESGHAASLCARLRAFVSLQQAGGWADPRGGGVQCLIAKSS